MKQGMGVVNAYVDLHSNYKPSSKWEASTQALLVGSLWNPMVHVHVRNRYVYLVGSKIWRLFYQWLSITYL